MQMLKKHFLTVNALLVFLVVVCASFLQGHLAYVHQLKHADRIVSVLAKIDQISFILLIGIALALVALYLIVYRMQKFNFLFFAVSFLLLLTLFSKGKVENIGLDSLAEIFTSNSQEAMDFATVHLLHVNLTFKEGLLLLAPLLLVPIYRSVSRGLQVGVKMRDIRRSFAVIAAVYFLTVATFGAKAWSSYHDIESYQLPMGQATQAALGGTVKQRAAPNLVVYIGESTDKAALGLNGSMRADHPLHDVRDNLIVYSDVIAPFSHTFPTLYRALTLADQPYEDQFLMTKDLRRASSIGLLNHVQFKTHWLSNQNLSCSLDWTSRLFGQRALHADFLNLAANGECPQQRKYDEELVEAFERRLAHLVQPDQVMFLHSYAGHDDYCKNIPQQYRRRTGSAVTTLPPRAVFGDLYIHNLHRHRTAIDCYESAVTYVASNLRTVIGRIAKVAHPVVFLYFSDHGEDVLEGTGHDSRKNSFRHIDIPFFVYFNQAAIHAYPDLYRAAHANRDRPYSLEWLSDSILDLAGVANARRPLLSIFQEALSVPPRYAMRRADIRGNHLILAIDDEDLASRHNMLNQGHDFYQKRRLLRTLPAAEAAKVCAAQADSLLKFEEAASIFNCVEVSVVIDAKGARLFAYQPPKKNNFLKLDHLIGHGIGDLERVVLAVRNANPDNLIALTTGLNAIIAPAARQKVVIRLPLYDGAEPAHVRQLAAAGYKVFYELPAYRTRGCIKTPELGACERLRYQIVQAINDYAFDGVALDVADYPFFASLQLDNRLALHVMDAAVKKAEDLHRLALGRSSHYTIPYQSAFDY